MRSSHRAVRLPFWFLLSLGVVGVGGAKAQDRDYRELAGRIVKTSAEVKPGDVVVVAGGKHDVALMEALAIEAAKAGGLVTMFLDSDKYERALYTEVPEQYLEQQPTYFAEWLKHMNVFIGLPVLRTLRPPLGMCRRSG